MTASMEADLASTSDTSEVQELTTKQRIAAGMMGPWRLTPIIVSLAAIWIFFAVQSSAFLSSQNLSNLTNQIAVSSLLALGLVFLLVVRQIDISLASLSAVAGAIAADLSVRSGVPIVFAVIAALVIGTLVSVAYAAIVVRFDTPAFVVTLGGLFILNAVLMWLLPDTQIVPLSDTPLQYVAGTYVAGVWSYLLAVLLAGGFFLLRLWRHRARRREQMPSRLVTTTLVPAVLLLALLMVAVTLFDGYHGVPTPGVIVIVAFTTMSYVAGQTPFGRHVYAVGGDPEAARRAGISVPVVTIIVFAMAGLLTSIAGIIDASRELGVSAESNDLTLLLGALAAVVIGGVSLFGGRGSVWGAFVGGIIIGSIENGLNLINASTQTQWTVEGIVLILAVILDAVISRAAPGADSR